jgi:hypothetical protein
MSEEARNLWIIIGICFLVFFPFFIDIMRSIVVWISKRWPSRFWTSVAKGFERISLFGKKKEPQPVRFVPSYFMDGAILILLGVVALVVISIVAHFVKSCGAF